ncbi:MAG: hypothetical protein AMXMBFR58_26210 [Phycisphaerae bacterium]
MRITAVCVSDCESGVIARFVLTAHLGSVHDLGVCNTKQEFMNAFSRAMGCESYFGHNWDAVVDVLADLFRNSTSSLEAFLMRVTSRPEEELIGMFSRALLAAAEDNQVAVDSCVLVVAAPPAIAEHLRTALPDTLRMP